MRKRSVSLILLFLLWLIAAVPAWAAAQPGVRWLDPLTSELVKVKINPAQPGQLLIQGQNLPAGQVLVEIRRGDDRAAYYFPVRNGAINGSFWLRFGSGQYYLTVYLPAGANFLYQIEAEARLEAIDLPDRRYLLPGSGVESDHPVVRKLAQDLAGKNAGARQKAYNIYRWVTRNIAYDAARLSSQQLYGPGSGALATLASRKGLCLDYANLTVALLRAASLPARVVVGQAYDRIWYEHAWAEVLLDGKWQPLDPTWDAGYLAGNRFIPRAQTLYFSMSYSQFYRYHRAEEYR
ncbi:Transglutaminase-like superfamily protein [Carboxydocella sporoproducens DSM 16521]|uniref:Transglutaminase-like superfamily protein n=2 Tax=Carboxydocella TaxID=178898 RepID=A0A1T4L7G4_9FIRM|nr:MULTISPECIES: transglutaminase-like domain-containing protein [Carboxydocella]AVX19933.1 Transglutaminase-like superfamily protein [Carboxydocella thermautotrophica]SJZ50490.1 Transglutaminase-like superfamily protein [Carboxydocella sporoproducens DSM 16521]